MSPGTSKGTLMEDSILHLLEKEEEGEMAKTKAASGENEATATVKVRSMVQVVAKMTRGHWAVRRKRRRGESQRAIVV